MFKRKYSIVFLFLFMLLTGKTCFSYAEKSYLWIEAESAENILFPVEILENKNCSGKKCIEIREGAGVGFLGAGGEAVYPIDVKIDGEYVIWGRVFWNNGCGNSFYLGIDEYRFNERGRNLFDYVLGHQLTFGKWMWVKGNKFNLSKGQHTLKIKNREDGVKLDKLLLTNDFEVVPHGFNRLSFSINSFAGKEFIKRGKNYKYKDFYSEIDHSVNTANQEDFSFLFSYVDAHNYKTVRFFNDKLEINSVENGKTKNCYQKSLPELESKQKSTVTFYCLNNQLSVAVNGKDIAFIDLMPFQGGFVGLKVSGEFPQVSSFKCIPIAPIYLEDNFYDALWHFSNNPLGWEEISGDWRVEMKDGFAYYNRGREQKEAMVVTGELWWRNYQHTAYVMDKGKSGFGLLFYFNDEHNFYLFKCEKKDGNGKFILIKRVKGEDIILAEKDFTDLDFTRWHEVAVKVFNGNIQTYIDDKNVFNINDNMISNGKVGLYGRNRNVVSFDDIYVESIYSKDEFLKRKKEYSPILYVNDLFDFYDEDSEYKEDKILDEVSKSLFDKQLASLPQKRNLFKNWHSLSGQWQIKENYLCCRNVPGISQLWCKRSFFGNITVELDCYFNNPETDELTIMLYQEDDGISNSIRILSNRIELLENLKLVDFADIAFGISANTKYHITIELAGDKLTCYLGRNKIIERSLKKIPLRIRPSFWTKNSNVYIDNVEIYAHPKKEYDFSVVSNAVEDFIEWEEETPYWEISFSDQIKGLRGIVKAVDEGKGSIVWNRGKYPSKEVVLEVRSRLFKLPETRGEKQSEYKIGMIICSEGTIDSGYRALFSRDNIILYRNGIEVSLAFLKDVNEGKWQWYRIQKTDKIIRIYISDFFGYDRLGLEYIDDCPVQGEKAGIQLVGTKNANVVFSPIYIY